jgi:hypothetical protein
LAAKTLWQLLIYNVVGVKKVKHLFRIFYVLVGSIILFTTTACSEYNTDIVQKNHKLVGTTVLVPDYTLVVSNINQSFSFSPIIHKIDAALVTLDDRLSVAAFPSGGMVVTHILPPKTKLMVKKVYKSNPSMLRSLFAAPSMFVVLSDKFQKRYTAQVYQDKISLETSFTPKQDNYWRHILVHMDKEKKQEQKINIEYFLKDSKGRTILDNSLRPPYPAEMMEYSKKNLKEFISKQELAVLTEDEYHPYISIVVNRVEIGNLILHYEELGIKRIGIILE